MANPNIVRKAINLVSTPSAINTKGRCIVVYFGSLFSLDRKLRKKYPNSYVRFHGNLVWLSYCICARSNISVASEGPKVLASGYAVGIIW